MTTLKTIKPVLKRVTKNISRPLLNHGLSNGDTLKVTDLETFITIKGLDLPAGLIDIGSLGITNKVVDLDTSEYPVFPVLDSKLNIIKVTIKTLELLLETASKDETRLHLQGVVWSGTDLVSTCGHMLTKIKNQTNNDLDSSIMPSSTIKEVIQLSKKYKVSEVSISVDDSFFKVDTTSFTIIGRLINREYPKYSAIIPTKTKSQCKLNSLPKFKDIKDILNPRSNAVKLILASNKASLTVLKTDFNNEVGTCDTDLEMGFNMKYLETLIKVDNIMKFNNELSPVVVEKGDIMRIAMPLRL